MKNIKPKYKKYPKYKDSGVEWLGEIPEEWELKRFKFLFKEINERSDDGSGELLSVSQYTGVTKKSDKVENGDLLTTASTLEGYKKVYKNDLVSNIMLAWNGSLGFSPFDGITSPAYSIYRLNKGNSVRFFHYLIRSQIYKSVFKRNSTGVIESRLRLYTENFFSIYSLLPPLPEQTAIADFLDDKTAKIDRAVAQKEKLIALLKERKQIIIQNAVTKGLNPNVKLKDSGIEWIGEIPEHWEVKRLKYLAHININSLSENTPSNYLFNYVDIGSVSFENGIEKTEKFKFRNAPSRARRMAKEGETIISTVRTYLKAIDYITKEKSKYIFSTGFAVLTPRNISKKFLYHFVRSNAFTIQVMVESKGMSYPAINSTDLSRLILAFPPISEQKQIVDYIETQSAKIDKAISLQQKQIEKLKEYKTVLIDSAVTGKIKVY